MKLGTGLLICVFALAGCERLKPTVEENILMRTFAVFTAGETHDEVCNGTDPKSRYDFSIKENAFRMGHEQMLAARMGSLIQMRDPDISTDDAVKRLLAVRDRIVKKTTKLLDDKGCESPEAASIKSAYSTFLNNPPAQISAFIDQKIKEEGGNVSPSAE